MDEGFHAARIEVHAPARLHLGFLDLEGGLGRRFGSIGLALDGIATHIILSQARRRATEPAPLVARADFPRDWPILLLLDGTQRGLHGDAELEAFRRLPPFPEALAGRLCRLLVMQLLPGIAERDFAAVAASIAEIQQR